MGARPMQLPMQPGMGMQPRPGFQRLPRPISAGSSMPVNPILQRPQGGNPLMQQPQGMNALRSRMGMGGRI